MAVTTDNLLVNISVNTEQAKASLDQLVKELGGLREGLKKTNDSVKKGSDGINGMGFAMVKLQAGISIAKTAFTALAGPVKAMIGEFAEAQDEQKNLANVLKLTGDNVRETFADFQDFADQMQETTVISGGMATQMLTTAKSMGLSNEQAKLLVKTSADLAAVTGDDVKQSFDGLVGTLKGNAKSVGEVGRLLGDLTKEELEAGKGVERLSEIFAGQGAAATATFAGGLKQLMNEFDSLMEELGGVIAAIFNLDDSTHTLSDSLKKLSSFVKENKETMTLLGKTVISLADDAFEALSGAVLLVASAFVRLGQDAIKGVGMVAKGLAYVGVVSDETVGSIDALQAAVGGVADSLTRGAVKAFRDVGDTGSSSLEGLTEKADILDNTMKGTNRTLRGAGKALVDAKNEGMKALDDLAKKVNDLKAANAGIGANEGDVVRQRAQAQLDEIQIMEKKLQIAGMLKGAAIEQVALARQLATEGRDKELGELRLKNAEEIVAKNRELAMELQANSLTQQQLIDQETALLITQIETKARGLELDEAGKVALQDQIALLKEKAAADKAKAPGEDYQGLVSAGKEVASTITGTFTQGALGMAAGAATMVTAIIDVVDAILDFIPGLINKIAGIFDKITDFPNVLLNAFKNLVGSIAKFTSDFIPNILSAIPEILDTLVTGFLETIPAASMKLLDVLPELIKGFLNKLPGILTKLVEGLIASSIEITMGIIDFLIKEGPQIAISIMKTIYIELPKAIIKGVVNGVKRIIDAFKGLFGGKMKVNVDTKEIEKAAKNLGRTLSGEASKLFAVLDMQQAAKAADNVKDIAARIEDGFKKGGNWLKEMWDKLLKLLKDAWLWVYDNVIKPIEDIVVKAWRWVWEKVIEPIVSALRSVWQWVYDKIIGPAIEGLKATWQFIWDTFLKPMVEGLKAAWQFIWDTLLKPFVDGLKAAWQFVYDTMLKPFVDGLKAAWQFIWDTLLKPFVDGLKAAWQFIVDIFDKGVTQALKNLWDNVKGIFDNIIAGFVTLWNSVKSIFDGIVAGFTTLWNSMKAIFDGVIAGFTTAWESIRGIFAGVIAGFTTAWEAIKKIFSDAATSLSAVWAALQAVFEWFKTNVHDKFAAGIQAVWDWFKTNILDKFASGVKAVFEWFKTNVHDKFAEVAKGAFTWVKENIVDKLKGIGEAGFKWVKENIIDKLTNFKMPKFDWPSMPKFSWPSMPSFSFPKLPTFSWPALPKLGIDFKAADIGGNMGAGLWNKLIALDIGKLGGNMAAGLWNKLITFDWGSLFGGGGGGGGGGPASWFADGGLVKPLYAAGGLMIPRGTDTVPAMLTPGEFVVNRNAVNSLGMDAMRMINRGQAPQAGDTNIDMKLEINTTQPIDETFIRTKLVPRMKEELRRASLDGQTTVYQNGVRSR